MRWLMHGFDSFLHHAFAWTGTFNESGGWYGFWSGFAADSHSDDCHYRYRKINCHTQNVGELVITISS